MHTPHDDGNGNAGEREATIGRVPFPVRNGNQMDETARLSGVVAAELGSLPVPCGAGNKQPEIRKLRRAIRRPGWGACP